ncbi:Putative Pumilio domain-containing protein [[Torrubiella] hemipterigena]|uniref:Putative Pumilio domain-containing protein n=1 Tax=[Torrubiella] hemipterigena TaxID=1531966 RepID=A0A0A1TAH9_9HYPO|nr:Putative Pumilio domain-containing protein [[Torrubiella] hemipterigena]
MDFRSQQPPRTEAPMSSLVSPPRNGGTRMGQQQPMHDIRSNLPRRFTTDSGRVPTLSSLTSPTRGPDSITDFGNNAMHKVQLIEKKKMEYERIREQRRRFELEMQKLDQQQRREAQELAQMEEEIVRLNGHQSEPTTPPEYRDTSSGFPSMFSRPNRYSTSSLTSPPGLFNRPQRSGSQITSPPSGLMQQRYGYDEPLPSRSMPGTRRNSDDEKEDAARKDSTSQRSVNAMHRYSMPATKTRVGPYESNLDQTNTARFLFGEDEPNAMPHRHTPDHTFPTLVRRDDQISLSSLNGSSSTQFGDLNTIGSRPASLRHSLDLKYMSDTANDSGLVSPKGSHVMTTPPKLQSSFSANDVSTTKAGNGASMMNANNHAQQHFHNHNASMGRIPASAFPPRHSRELSADTSREQNGAFPSFQSALQGNAAPFGPPMTTAPFTSSIGAPQIPNNGMNAFQNFYPGANYQVIGPNVAAPVNPAMLQSSMQQLNLNGLGSSNQFSNQNFNNFGAMPFNQGNQQRDSQARVIQNRRQVDNDAMSRYQNTTLESVRTQIYQLCKDQHGCRFLQKKLEEGKPDQVHMIWQETNPHVVELMTDPFGNYLCQKLLEYCNDDERTVLIQNASQDMVRIALNQHGTRALQKMIEYVSTPQQVSLIMEALRYRVVELIQDLNGNHVIQKCLNKLSSVDAQFIFDAVGNHSVEVGTHKHGCCVLQRCIDHASGDQKRWLVQKITQEARRLVQDPFGNYVIQYIIDLNEPTFTEPLVSMFQGCIGHLSRQKFSSNVIEKCLRCAQAPSKDLIVEEMLSPTEIENLLRDNYANYVIQTALEFATPHQKYRLVEAIRPILPQIRTTPYGRRIQAKVSAYDNRGSASSSGQVTPADNTQGQIPLRPGHARGVSSTSSIAPIAAPSVAPAGLNNQVNPSAVGGFQVGPGLPAAPGAPGAPGAIQQPPFGQRVGPNTGNGVESEEARWL